MSIKHLKQAFSNYIASSHSSKHVTSHFSETAALLRSRDMAGTKQVATPGIEDPMDLIPK